MKVGRFVLFFYFFILFTSSVLLSNNSIDVEIYGNLCGVGLYDYNSYIDLANERNKTLGVNSLLQRINYGIMPELTVCYQININHMFLGLYLKNQHIFVLNGKSEAQWGNGNLAQIIDANFNVSYTGGGLRFSISSSEFKNLAGFFGVDCGICYYFWNKMYEEINQEDGTNIYKINKQWSTIIPAINIDTGIQWMLNETFGFVLKGGYRFAVGNVTVKINNINGWTEITESEDSVNFSGFYGGIGMVLKHNILHKKEKDIEDKMDKSVKFPGLSEWIYKEAKSLYDDGLYKQAKEKILEAEKIAGENEAIAKLKIQIEKELNTENVVDKINKLNKLADEYRYKKQFQKARKIYQEIITIDDTNKKARFYLDEFDVMAKEEIEKTKKFIKQGKLKEALKSVNLSLEYGAGKEAIDLKTELEYKIESNKSKDKLYNEGVDKYRKGKYEEAIKKWQMVLQLDPSDKDSQENIKKAMAKIKEIEKEEDSVIKKSINEAKNFYNIGNFDVAYEKCEYVLRLVPDNIECKKMLEQIKKIQEENKVEVIKKR